MGPATQPASLCVHQVLADLKGLCFNGYVHKSVKVYLPSASCRHGTQEPQSSCSDAAAITTQPSHSPKLSIREIVPAKHAWLLDALDQVEAVLVSTDELPTLAAFVEAGV